MKFCPQCGTAFEPEDSFCRECGFDKSMVLIVKQSRTSKSEEEKRELGEVASSANEQPVINLHSPTDHVPIETDIITPAVPQKQPEPVENKSGKGIGLNEGIKPLLGKYKSLRLILIWIVIVLLLGIIGWVGYTALRGAREVTIQNPDPNMELPPVQDFDAASPNKVTIEEPAESQSEKLQETAKPKTRMDEELAKQKAKEKNKPKPQVNSTQKTNSVSDEKISANTTEKDNQADIIFEVGRKDEPKGKNPKNPTKFTISVPTMIVRITTDHYNNGMGTSGGGKITIKDKWDNVIAVFKAYGKTGKDGTPNAKWVAEPHKILEEGTYFIWDSDMATWSKSFWGTGFVVIEGYEVE